MRLVALLVPIASASLALHCGGHHDAPAPPTPVGPAITDLAGFVEVPARNVTVKGQSVRIDATARLFYNLRRADDHAEDKPIFVLFNGFAAEIVRAYGTGPTTVVEGGAVEPNAASWTKMANLLYIEPRQAGYSYDVVAARAPSSSLDCGPGIFNEYVDAADVLLGVFAFLEAHPELRGPVYWVAESYAGVRVTWILAYLRGRFDLASYADATLAQRVATSRRTASMRAGQILLEPWLAGGAQSTAIDAVCADAGELAAVSASIGVACAGTDACACARANDRSLYNFTYTVERETLREDEASAAHVIPDRAAALLGVPLTSVALLAASERARGFKCSTRDDTVPNDDALVATLGALPMGQSYWLPYSPLLPGKEIAPTTLDWRTRDSQAIAFVDNLHDVPAFITNGALDLVVPTRSLAPALRAVIGSARVDATSSTRLTVSYADGRRTATIASYANAGHMVSMAAPSDLAADVTSWLTMTMRR